MKMDRFLMKSFEKESISSARAVGSEHVSIFDENPFKKYRFRAPGRVGSGSIINSDLSELHRRRCLRYSSSSGHLVFQNYIGEGAFAVVVLGGIKENCGKSEKN